MIGNWVEGTMFGLICYSENRSFLTMLQMLDSTGIKRIQERFIRSGERHTAPRFL